MEREFEKKQNMLIREAEEREVARQTKFVLIYPLLTYKQEFKIESLFQIEEKKLNDEIQDKLGSPTFKKKITEDEKAQFYVPNVPEYEFNL